jgi:hypothetical protein
MVEVRQARAIDILLFFGKMVLNLEVVGSSGKSVGFGEPSRLDYATRERAAFTSTGSRTPLSSMRMIMEWVAASSLEHVKPEGL